jgi:hypothetical protein
MYIADFVMSYAGRPPFYGLPGADAFVNATDATASQAVAAATDATYYAIHDELPPGVTSIPALAGPTTCAKGHRRSRCDAGVPG